MEKGFVTPFFAVVVGRSLLVKGVTNPFSIFACASGIPQILVRGSIAMALDLHYGLPATRPQHEKNAPRDRGGVFGKVF
jgi:hypothetical protein